MKDINNVIEINVEYEKMVPVTKRKSLFEESEGYESLREYILSQPQIYYSKKDLPFKGVTLISYVKYRKKEVIDKAISDKKHLFYIKQSHTGKADFCDAAGYYIIGSNRFVVLPYSHIVNTKLYDPGDYSKNVEVDGDEIYTVSQLEFNSPADAASYVLGRKSRLDEWIDSSGKGLQAYYKELQNKKPKPVEDWFDGFNSIYNSPEKKGERHVLYIQLEGICDASGYYEAETGYFYILKGSKLALETPPDFNNSPIGQARARLVASNCIAKDGYYIVQKDSKCRSASAAASYALGKDVTYVEWIAEDGKGLKDFYPETFKLTKNLFQKLTQIFKERTESSKATDYKSHLFYIKKSSDIYRACDAKGYYDNTTKKFIILSGSKWSFGVTTAYRYSASEMLRRDYIRKYCVRGSIYYQQKEDVVCDSPSMAASFVLGTNANGWEDWIDENGETLKDNQH